MHKKLLVTAYFVIAALLQTLAGNFPLSFFAFPLNVIVAVIWIYSLWRLYKEGNKLPLTRFLLSSRTSVLSILLLIGGSLVIGLFPQLSEAEADSIPGVLALLGCYNFMTSWIFIAILFLLLSNLAMVIIHAFYHCVPAKKRFILNHLGLWLALFAGFMPDNRDAKLIVWMGKPIIWIMNWNSILSIQNIIRTGCLRVLLQMCVLETGELHLK